jgi:hypothetical protein
MTRDDQTWSAEWQAWAERWVAGLRATADLARSELTDGSKMVAALAPRAQAVATRLMAQDDELCRLLLNLHRRLQQWLPLGDHATSAAAGIIADHLAADRNLAAAVADVIDLLEQDNSRGVTHE